MEAVSLSCCSLAAAISEHQLLGAASPLPAIGADLRHHIGRRPSAVGPDPSASPRPAATVRAQPGATVRYVIAASRWAKRAFCVALGWGTRS